MDSEKIEVEKYLDWQSNTSKGRASPNSLNMDKGAMG